jgi:hypothetical protein
MHLGAEYQFSSDVDVFTRQEAGINAAGRYVCGRCAAGNDSAA